MDAAATQATFLLRQSQRWLANLENRHRALVPLPGLKSAGWLLGHLVVTGDFGRRLCGLAPIASKEWRALFSPGTFPSLDADSYPPMQTLVATFRSVYSDFAARAPAASVAALDEPNPYEPARADFPTGRDFARYLLTGHLAHHLGQLSVWRVAAAAIDPNLRA
jgi:DinB superfamily